MPGSVCACACASVSHAVWMEREEEGGKGEKCTKRQTAAAAKESRSFLQNECDYCGRPSGLRHGGFQS